MAQSFAEFEVKLQAVLDEFDGTAAAARMARVAKATERDVDEAVRGTLGDLSMSGWRRGAPIDITGISRVRTDSAFISAGRASGPMRVLQDGRHPGGGMQGPGVSPDGTTARTKAGKVRKVRKARRWNGSSPNKDTWTHAAELMQERVPKRIAAEVHAALKRHLNGG